MENSTLFEPTGKPPRGGLSPVWKIVLPLLFIAGGGFWFYLATTPPPPKTHGDEIYVPPAGLLHKGDKDFDWYWEFLKITDVKGQIVFNFAGDRVVVINGIFDNRGERAVEAAEIKITFFDTTEKVFRERVVAPMRMETGMKQTLKSLEKRGFSVRFENMPVDLQVGRLEVVLTGVKLAPRGQVG